MADTQRLYNEATELYGRARALLEASPSGMSAEQSAQYDTIMEQFDGRIAEAKRLERGERAAGIIAEASQPQARLGVGGVEARSATEDRQLGLLRNWFKGAQLSAAERKDLSAGVDAQGGISSLRQCWRRASSSSSTMKCTCGGWPRSSRWTSALSSLPPLGIPIPRMRIG